MILLGLSLIFSIAMAVHVVRSGREWFWIWIILILQPLGGIIYFAAVVLPELMGGPTARKIGQSARSALDPHREYREAKAACEETPTAGAMSRLAAAAMHLGHYAEAEGLYARAAQGPHADDPVLLLGRAKVLIELNKPAEAHEVLQRLAAAGGALDEGEEALAIARALEGMGRNDEAEIAYQRAVERLPGLESLARHAAFMARTGRRAEAQEIVAELDRRVARTHPQFRKEGRAWRDLAAQALS
ncbi:hypothetical protein [Phenylobacterium sp.]|uniref:hypothetical protein n=1 Tax=Phenylobacterium sp. TaxID=1871053 RepID=UPI0035AEADB0